MLMRHIPVLFALLSSTVDAGPHVMEFKIQEKIMARLPAALCYLDVPSMTMMDPASPVRIVPAWSRLPNEPIKIARR
jgi:hypothetical protein